MFGRVLGLPFQDKFLFRFEFSPNTLSLRQRRILRATSKDTLRSSDKSFRSSTWTGYISNVRKNGTQAEIAPLDQTFIILYSVVLTGGSFTFTFGLWHATRFEGLLATPGHFPSYIWAPIYFFKRPCTPIPRCLLIDCFLIISPKYQ